VEEPNVNTHIELFVANNLKFLFMCLFLDLVIALLQILQLGFLPLPFLPFVSKLLVKSAILIGHAIAFILDFLQFLLSVLDVFVRFYVIKFKFLVQFFILVGDHDQFLRRLREHGLQVFDLFRHWLFNVFYLLFILFLNSRNLIFVHSANLGSFGLVLLLHGRPPGRSLRQIILWRVVIVVGIRGSFLVDHLLQEFGTLMKLLVKQLQLVIFLL
jgi:hypothetical protein